MSDDGENRSWWSRNWLSLVVLGVLVVVTPAVVIGNSVRQERSTSPTEGVVVDRGRSAEYGGATVGPVTATFDNDEDAPPNTRVVRATIELDDASSLFCLDPTLSETTGNRRNFGSTTLLLSGDEVRATTACSAAAGDTYQISLTYIVPTDATGPFVIDFVSPDALPRYLEFKVQP